MTTLDPTTRTHVLVATTPAMRARLGAILDQRRIPYEIRRWPVVPEDLAGAIVYATELPLWYYEHTDAVLAPGLPSSGPAVPNQRASRAEAYFTVDALPSEQAARARTMCRALVGTRGERRWYARRLRRQDGLPGRLPGLLGIGDATIRSFSPRARELRGLHAAGVLGVPAASTAASATVHTPSGLRTFRVRRLDTSR
jgi:hypothetical protein